jgi:hypothetical protein
MSTPPRRDGRLVFQLTARRGATGTAPSRAAAGWPRAVRATSLRARWLAAGWLLAWLALPVAGRAEQVASGGTLTVSNPCAEVVELREDPSLGGGSGSGAGGRVAVAAEPEGTGPTVASGEAVRVGGPCRARAERLRLRVSPGLAVRLAGDAAWQVAALGGTVDATLDGREDAEFGALRVLRLRRSGSGDTHVDGVAERFEATLSGAGGVTVDRLAGTAALHVGEAATVTVDHVALDSLDLTGDGGSRVVLGTGRIGELSAAMSEGSRLNDDAVVTGARLAARGAAGIDVARVDGALDRDAREGGRITVHAGSGADAMTAASGGPGGAYDMRVRPDAPARLGEDVANADGAWQRAHGGAPGWLPPALVALALVGSVAVARRAQQRRLGSLRTVRSRPRSRSGGARVPEPDGARVLWPGDPGVAALGHRLAAVEARLVRVERYVTSGELELQRQFRDLAR